MENRIEIDVKKSISTLTGNEYGRIIFEEQVLPNIKMNCKNFIVFPSHIERIAISFIEGFLKNLPNDISRKDFYEFFSIEGTEKVVNKFLDVVLMG